MRIAKYVLANNFGGLCHKDTFGLIGTGGSNAGVKLIDYFGYLGVGSRRNLANIW